MLRLLPALCLAQTGCSLLLDFSDSQIPIDAPPDIFTSAECMFGEPNDSFAAATVYEPGTPAMAAIGCTIGVDDADFYKFTVPAGTTSMTVEILFESRFGDLDLHLFNAEGIPQANSSGNLDNEKIVCPGVAPTCDLGTTPPIPEGEYTFEVRHLANVFNTYSITITLTQ